jgi:hypothetical protein
MRMFERLRAGLDTGCPQTSRDVHLARPSGQLSTLASQSPHLVRITPSTLRPPELNACVSIHAAATDRLATRKSWHKQGGRAMNEIGYGTEPQSQSRSKWASGPSDSASLDFTSRQRSARKPLGSRARRAFIIAGRPMAARLPLALSATIALCGCATTQPVRYVSVYCVPSGTQLPAEPPKVHDQLTGHADKDAGILAGSAIRLRAWGQALNHILEGCREPTH